MGQQQLLLLVLGIVIVGLAVVAGIQAFGENSKRSNADAMVNDAVRIANDIQAWAMKPAAFGGGDNSFQPTSGNVTFEKLGYTVNAEGNYDTINGEYVIAVTGPLALTITGTNTQHSNEVVTTVSGLQYNHITTTVNAEGEAGGTE